eukprot:2054420-Rhodomonas_salina.1
MHAVLLCRCTHTDVPAVLTVGPLVGYEIVSSLQEDAVTPSLRMALVDDSIARKATLHFGEQRFLAILRSKGDGRE